MFRCTSSSFTKSVFWERLRDVVLTRLADPALYDVSVRSLAALTRMRPAAKTGRYLRTHSQASTAQDFANEIRSEVALEWAQRVNEKAKQEDLKPANVGTFDALFYESMIPSQLDKEIR